MRFRVLGPVEVHTDDGQVLTPPRRQERCLLAVLLLEVGRTVPIDRLCNLLWPDRTPQRPREVLRSQIARLRGLLGHAGAAEPGVMLASRQRGYLLDVDPDMVDVHRFRRGLDTAARTADLVTRDRLLCDALAEWHGPALQHAATDDVRQRLCADLDELYLHATEESLATGIALGRHRELLPELARLTSEHATRERLVELHMLALYHDGRTAQALDVYHRARTRLADELGIDPGPALQQMHTAILRDEPLPPIHPSARQQGSTTAAPDPRPFARVPDATAGSIGPDVPTQLPADLPHFTGRHQALENALADRDRPTRTRRAPAAQQQPTANRTLPTDVAGFVGRYDELQHLLAAVDAAIGAAVEGAVRAVAIHAVDGMAGVGKTAFAVHAAHHLATRFPDGQRFVDLRAHAPGQTTVDPAAALEILLQADGVAPHQVPAGLDARAGLWRDRMADKRLLLVLDDAANPAHVVPLLPAAPGCLVLITSRRKLTTLPGAVLLSLDTLPPADAAQLFIHRGGPRASRDPAAVERITRLCGHLPLAITLTAARLHTHPTWSVADLADDLDQARDRLTEMASGDLAVAAAFDLSYHDLPAERQRLFRRLALHLGSDFDAYAAAALDHTTLTAARRGLEDLLEHNLLTEPNRGRYRFHDLIAVHARTHAAADPQADRDAALDRLLTYYLHTATTAAARLHTHTTPSTQTTPAGNPPAPALTFTNAQQAADWFTIERPNLVAATDYAATHHHTAAAVGIPAALRDHLRTHGPWELAVRLQHTALTTAQHADGQPKPTPWSTSPTCDA